MQLMICRN